MPGAYAAAWHRHPLLFFFLIAFAGAWLLELPVVLSRTGTGLLPYTLPRVVVLLAIAAATFTGPMLSAFVRGGGHRHSGDTGPAKPPRRAAVAGVGSGRPAALTSGF